MMPPLIRARLQTVVDRKRRLQFWSRLAGCWTVAAFLGLGLLILQRQIGWASSLVLPVVATLGVVAAIVLALRHRRADPDWRRVAAEIEARHPKLDGRLLTAVQQEAKGGRELNYLQDRLVHEVVAHHAREDWAEMIPDSRIGAAQLAHLLALVFFGAVLFGLRTTGGHSLLARIADSAITVTPGDTSIERGNSLVVLARFGGGLPVTVDLVVGDSSESSRRIPLVKSLADPMFGGSVSEVTSNLVYRIEFAGQQTRDFKVTVFDYPRLERSDADLTYPDYTGLSPKHIKDTRRLTAVEGSRVDLNLQLNKPVTSAHLIEKNKETKSIPLIVETNRAVAELKQFLLETNKTYELQLVDAENRTNKVPAQFVFVALKNRTPELTLTSPRGDVRPSPLEEISFDGTVWDDFGVQAYGLAYALVNQEPQFIELGQPVAAKEKHPFQYVLRIEDLGLQPDQLISWFVWADDIGPDGQVRRSTGDLFFAEVRPFEEIYREGQPMDGQSSGQQPSQTAKLAELQKQIINATWRLQREHGSSTRPAETQPAAPRKSGKDNSPTSDSRGRNSGSLFVETSPSPPPTGERAGVRGRHVSPTRAVPKIAQTQPLTLTLSPSEGEREFSRPTPDPSQERNSHKLASKDSPLLGGVGGGFGPLVFGQRAAESDVPSPFPKGTRSVRENTPGPTKTSQYESDAVVVLDSQAQALEQAEATAERQQDPRAAILWRNAVEEMKKAVKRLNEATNSPAAMADALVAEQAAYEALLKLQQHEYQVMRQGRNQRGGGGGRDQQMQRQLEQLDLTQSENRYETQSKAQSPQSAERREQLQVMNRLQELARRQQDLNDRLKELQTALQEARSEEEREEIKRRLKRLQEEEQQMLADVDEVRQRMDRPENQSRMAEERKQVEQTRNDVQRAAEAASQGSASQALASGTRAQRQLQELRDQMRKENSSQFADELRQMRAEARELARQQEDIQKKMDTLADSGRKTLDDSTERQQALDQLAQQKQRLTNVVEKATQLSQQTEEAEPLVSHQLYDTLRKFSQDDANTVKEFQQELIQRGLIGSELYDRIKRMAEKDDTKSLELTSEMLRREFLPQARQAEGRARSSINDLKRGVERAAESVLGDDTEALRLAQQELDKLTDQLQREIARPETDNSETNQEPRQVAAASAGQPDNKPASGDHQPSPAQNPGQQPGQSSQANGQGQQTSDPAQARGNASQQSAPGQASVRQSASARGGQRSGSRDGRVNSATTDGDGNYRRGGSRFDWDRILDGDATPTGGPITGDNFGPWSDRLRDVEEMIDLPDLRTDVATARERVRLMRQDFKRDLKKPDWVVVRLQVIKPLVEVRDRIAEELARRQSTDSLVPIDRDPVPSRFSELVRRYYEELGKDK